LVQYTYGGALVVNGPVLTLNKCFFVWNKAEKGGAIYVASGRVFLFGTTFSGSTTANDATSYGDELYLDPISNPTVVMSNGEAALTLLHYLFSSHDIVLFLNLTQPLYPLPINRLPSGI
jgi:hypothetical protein